MANTQTTFGATIVPTVSRHEEHGLLPQPISPALTPSVSRDGSHSDFYDEHKPVPVHSPFYQHPPASHEAMPRTSQGKLDTVVLEKDVESGNVTPLSPNDDDDNPFSKHHNVESNKECTMWPSKHTLKQKQKAEKRSRRSKAAWGRLVNRWSALTPRRRMSIKIAVALFLVGVAVAIGVGISAAVKGTYYVSDDSSKTVG